MAEPAAVKRRGGLAGAALILMAAFVASRATGLLRDVAVTYQFGLSREMDAYLAAISIPDTIFQLTAGGAVASAFIPVFTAYLTRDEVDDAWRMVSTLFNLAVVALSPLLILAIVFAPQLMGLLAPSFEPEYRLLAGQLARILLVSPLFFTLGCFTTSVLNSHQRFFLAALAPTCYNLGIIVGALLFAPRLGIYGLALGATLGSLLFLLVQAPGLWQVGMRYRAVLDFRLSGVREVGRLMVPRTIGLAASQVNFMVGIYLASGVVGGVSALNRAWLLTMLPLGVFAMAISSAVFPSLAAQSAQAEVDAMRQTVQTSLRFILFLTIPATVGLLLLAEPVVRLLFERGAFSAEATAMTANALRYYAPGLVAMAAVEIVTRVFYAFHDTRTPVGVAVGGMLLNLALAVALVPVLSYGGLAAAMTVSSTIGAAALLYLAQRRLPGLFDWSIVRGVGQSGAAALLMGLVILGLAHWGAPLATGPLLAQALGLGTAIGGGAVAYLVAALLLRSDDARRVLGALRRRG